MAEQPWYADEIAAAQTYSETLKAMHFVWDVAEDLDLVGIWRYIA